jgi:LysM repeat protein/prefoldin subunit 5
MKFYKLLMLLALSLTLSVSTSAFAQDDDDDDDMEMEEMDEEEWQRQMDELSTRRTDLQNQLNSLNTDIDALKKQLAQKDADLTKAENDLYASVGATKSEVASFRTKFEALEKRINSKTGTKEDAEKEFAEIEASKIRCLPEFWDRYQAMKTKLANWGPGPVAGYTVVRGDCLWKIAGMPQHYGNPRLWPAIWEANRNGVVSAPPRVPKTIPNPNLIYPGQVLKIPTLTDAQKTEYLSKRYYAPRRRTRMRSNTNNTNTNNDTKNDTKKDEKKDMKKDEKKDTKK